MWLTTIIGEIPRYSALAPRGAAVTIPRMAIRRRRLVAFLVLLAASILLASIGPPERVLGSAARVVYLHGAWVWTALIAFAVAAASGLAGLVRRSDGLHRWSTGWARSGILLWLTSLLLSLWAMQTSWNGLYLAEPRWRLGVQFGVVAILLQLAILLIHRPPVASALNAAFFAALALALLTAKSVLHPSAPIANTSWDLVRVFFLALLAITLLAAWQLAGLLQPRG